MKKLKQVLLADDDKANNFLNVCLLEEMGIAEEITVLLNGKEALEYLLAPEADDKPPPELVILDHLMPVMDGLELMRELYRTGFTERKEVVFLLLAAHSSPKAIEEFKRLGVQEYTTKPLSEEVVLRAWQKYLAYDTAGNHSAK